MTLQDYLPIVMRVLGHFEVRPDSLDLRIKDVKYGGRTGWRTRGRQTLFYITLPKWLENHDESYAIYYCIHEACHVVDHLKYGYNGPHSEMFKEIEDEALALWGLKIERAKAYPKELYANGQQIKNILR